MIPLPGARPFYDKLAHGWNTWDVRSVTTQVYLPDGLGIQIGFVCPALCRVWNELAWDEVEQFGEHALDGSFTDVTVVIHGFRYRITSTAENDTLVVRIVPISPSTHEIFLTAEVSLLWGAFGSVGYTDSAIEAKTSNATFFVDTPSATIRLPWNPCRQPHLVGSGADTFYLRVNSRMQPDTIDSSIDTARKRWLETTIHSEGDFEHALGAMRRSLLWNTIYEPRNRRVLTPVSRNWCKPGSHFGDYVLFEWDTFFAALMFGMIRKDLAYANFFAMLEEISPEGMIPNSGSGACPSDDRSEPPVGAWCAWKLYLQYKDTWFIEQVFDCLLAWNTWRFRERDFNKDGLLEPASIPAYTENPFNKHRLFGVGEKQGAMYESGLDNSPMWDDATFNTTHHCMELSYVGLNALMVADCECLAKMAALLGRKQEQEILHKQRHDLVAKINRELWSEDHGIYLNRHWNGHFSEKLSPTHLYTLMAGISSPPRASRMIQEHLLNPQEFLGDYMIPTISRSDPSFQDQDYWRGRIWAPTNFLVVEGLKRAGRYDIASHVVQSGYSMFLKCWKEYGIVGENYNAITGRAAEPDTVSDRFYHWGALMVYMAVQEMVDFQVWDDTVQRRESPEYLGPLRNVPEYGKKCSKI